MNEEFQIGETVLVVSGMQGNTLHKGEVFGETKTCWRVKHVARGKEITELYTKRYGDLRGSGTWSHSRINKFDEKEWQEYILKREKQGICYTLKEFDWQQLELDDLREIYQLAKETMEKKTDDESI